MLIRAVEEAAKIWLYAQFIEVISACLIEPNWRGIAMDVQAGRGHFVGDQPMETSVSIAEIKIVEIGIRGRAILSALDHVEILSLRHIHRSKDQCIQNAEYHSIRSDSQRQSYHGHSRKARRLAKHAEPEP